MVAKVGSMELADKLWPELLGELLRNMGASDVAFQRPVTRSDLNKFSCGS